MEVVTKKGWNGGLMRGGGDLWFCGSGMNRVVGKESLVESPECW